MGYDVQEKNKNLDKQYKKELNLSDISDKTFRMNQQRRDRLEQKEFDYQTEISKNMHMFDQLKDNKKAYSEFVEHSMQYTSQESLNGKQLKAIEKEAAKVSERSQKRREHHLKKMNTYGKEIHKEFLANDQLEGQGSFAELMNSLDLIKNMFKYQMHFIRLYGKKDELEKMQEDALRVACLLKMHEMMSEFNNHSKQLLTKNQKDELQKWTKWMQDEQKNSKNKTEAENQGDSFQQWSGTTDLEKENKYQFREHRNHTNMIRVQKKTLSDEIKQNSKVRKNLEKERLNNYIKEHKDYQLLKDEPKNYSELLQQNFEQANDYCKKMIKETGKDSKDFELGLKNKLTTSGVAIMQKEEIIVALRMVDCCCYGYLNNGYTLDCYSRDKAFLFMARRYPEKIMADENLLEEGRIVLKSFFENVSRDLSKNLSTVTMETMQEQEQKIINQPDDYKIAGCLIRENKQLYPDLADGNYLASFEGLKEMYRLQKLKNYAKEKLGMNKSFTVFMHKAFSLRTIKTNQDWKLHISFNSIEEYETLGKKVMEGLLKKNLSFKIVNPEFFSQEKFEANNVWAKQITIYPYNKAFYTLNEDGSWISKEVDEILFGSSSKNARTSSSDQVLQHDGHSTRVTARYSGDKGFLIDKNNHYKVDNRTINANEMADQCGGYKNTTLQDIISFPTAMQEATIGNKDLNERFGGEISSISKDDILKLKRYGQSIFLSRNDVKAEEVDMIYDFYLVNSITKAKSMEIPGIEIGPECGASALAYVEVPGTNKFLVGVLKDFFVEDLETKCEITKPYDKYRL